jgi:putative sigma-54 modulation protein
MKIDFVGRHLNVDERIRTHTEEKIGKILKFLWEPIEVHVTLDTERHRQIAEFHVSHRRGTLHAREENAEMLDAVDLAIGHLERQARRFRKKTMDRRLRARRSARVERHWPVEVLQRESVGSAEGPRIVKSSRFEIKPMTLEEAALHLESSRNEFVVFLDAENDKVSVLYKRRDDDYGLIAPEV